MMEYKQPKNWPGRHRYSPESIGKETHMTLLRLAVQSPNPEDRHKIVACIEEKKAHPHLEIRKLRTPHPLNGQYGVFAKRAIPRGAALGEFVGEVTLIHRTDAMKQQKLCYNYIIPLDDQNFWCIDSDAIANEMMYVNDYRGLKDAPNAHLTRMTHRSLYYFGYVALKDIGAEEEILVYYGESIKLP